MPIIGQMVSKESISAAKDIVKLVGFGLGNLLYRINTGTLIREDVAVHEENKRLEGTSFFVLGGSIGTNGYTRELLPLYARSQYRRRFSGRAEEIKDHRILTPRIDSADAGALGATLAFGDEQWSEIQKDARRSYAKGIIPLLPLIDIGGTKINFILAHFTREGELNFEILLRERFQTPKNLTPDEFYARLSEIISPIIASHNSEPYRVISTLGLAQPGEFATPTGEIKKGAFDLGPFIGYDPSEALKTLLGAKHLPMKVYACNDGQAQFNGIMGHLERTDQKTWRKICDRKVMYLGIGTGLGAGHGCVDGSGKFVPDRFRDLGTTLARDEAENMESAKIETAALSGLLTLPYKYGDLVSSRFFNISMRSLEEGALKAAGASGHPSCYFLPHTGLRDADAKTIQKFFESSGMNPPLNSPLNPRLINELLENEIKSGMAEHAVDDVRHDLEECLEKILDVISGELRGTLVHNVWELDGVDSRSYVSDYEDVIAAVIAAKQRGRRVHFVGIGKSHSIGQNLAYIYSNLGINSASLVLTGADSENLTNLEQGDLVFLISNSGEACELLELVEYIHKKKCRTVALTGNPASPLAKHCKFVISSHVDDHEHPTRIPEAPTTSTTSALAAGTAIGMVVSYDFHYDKEQFFIDHPGLEFSLPAPFDGVEPDRSFDARAKVEDIFAQFAQAIATISWSKEFAEQIIRLVRKVLTSHYNHRTVFLTGAGASFHVAEKVAATMTSIGIDAVSVNSAQLPHGDFAHIVPGDLLIVFSFGGDTRHLVRICRIAEKKQVDRFVITSNPESSLARMQGNDFVIAGQAAEDTGLVPIPDQKILSSFINLTVGDALATLLARVIEASVAQFAIGAHQGGVFGRQENKNPKEVLRLIAEGNVDVASPDLGLTEEHWGKCVDLLKTHLGVVGRDLPDGDLVPVLAEEFLAYGLCSDGLEADRREEVLVFGMGSIGIAYLGNMLDKAGKQITFVDSDSSKLESARDNGNTCTLLPCGGEGCDKRRLGGFACIHAANVETIAARALRARTVYVAIGVKQIDSDDFVNTIAYIAMRRYAYQIKQPLNIIFNENFPLTCDALARLRYRVRQRIESPDIQVYFADHIGLVPAIDEALVPEITSIAEPIRFQESYPPLFIDRSSLKEMDDEPFTIPGVLKDEMLLTDHFYPLHMRKLWMHNMAHALIGYLGYQRGYDTIFEAISDARIEEIVRKALWSVGRVIFRRWSFNNTIQTGPESGFHDLASYIDWRIRQYKNEELYDTVERVCRDPKRKLDINDRLIGPVNCIMKYGTEVPSEILLGVEAAMLYYSDICVGNPAAYNEIYEEVEGHLKNAHDSKHLLRARRELDEFRRAGRSVAAPPVHPT